MTTLTVVKPWTGTVTLPDPADFTGAMAQTWRRLLKKEYGGAVSLSRREMYAFAALDFIHEHADDGAGWDIADADGALELDTVRAWQNHYHKAKVRLLSWLGKAFEEYLTEVLDPNG